MTVSRLFVVLALVLLSAFVTPDASAFIIGSNVAISGPSSLTHTVAVTNDSGAPVTVTFTVGNTDFVVPVGSVLGEYVADAEFVTGSGTLALNGYADTTNTAFGTELLIGSANEVSVPYAAPAVPFTLAGPYALTLTALLTLEPLASLSFTHTVSVVAASTAVPEPGSAMLLAVGLSLVGIARRRRIPRGGCSRGRR